MASQLGCSRNYIIQLAKGERQFGRGAKARVVAEYFRELLSLDAQVDSIITIQENDMTYQENALRNALHRLSKEDHANLFNLQMTEVYAKTKKLLIEEGMERIERGEHKEERLGSQLNVREALRKTLSKLTGEQVAYLYDVSYYNSDMPGVRSKAEILEAALEVATAATEAEAPEPESRRHFAFKPILKDVVDHKS